jgi:1-acyl-sn-glycerol-3-phosphate acyltransferase
VLVIGGAQEALYANPGTYSLVLNCRFGFVKKALVHGVPLVPVFAFGENDLFFQTLAPEGSLIRRLQNGIRRVLSFSTPMFYGRGIFNYTIGVLPQRTPVTIVVGAPIPCVKNTSPTADEIRDLHTKYVQALKDLFEGHKMDYGLSEDAHLDIH